MPRIAHKPYLQFVKRAFIFMNIFAGADIGTSKIDTSKCKFEFVNSSAFLRKPPTYLFRSWL